MSALFVALGLVAVGGAVASARYPAHPLVDRFGAAMTTDALSILVTLAVVNRLLERQERSRRMRGSLGALRMARAALLELVFAWADLIRTASAAPPRSAALSLDHLFACASTDALVELDLSLPTVPGSTAAASLARRCARRLRRARGQLRGIIVAQAHTLDHAYVEALDALVDDPFLTMVIELADRPQPDRREWRVRLTASRGLRVNHFDSLLAAVALHNQLGREAARLRARISAPQTDRLGLPLEQDHDLRVPTELPGFEGDAEWTAGAWRSGGYR